MDPPPSRTAPRHSSPCGQEFDDDGRTSTCMGPTNPLVVQAARRGTLHDRLPNGSYVSEVTRRVRACLGCALRPADVPRLATAILGLAWGSGLHRRRAYVGHLDGRHGSALVRVRERGPRYRARSSQCDAHHRCVHERASPDPPTASASRALRDGAHPDDVPDVSTGPSPRRHAMPMGIFACSGGFSPSSACPGIPCSVRCSVAGRLRGSRPARVHRDEPLDPHRS